MRQAVVVFVVLSSLLFFVYTLDLERVGLDRVDPYFS